MKLFVIIAITMISFVGLGQNSASPQKETIPEELTIEQQASFDALNTLQVNSAYHLYSTFLGSQHPCTPVDTVFTLSRRELTHALEELQSRYFTRLSKKDLKKLTKAAVLAQEEYIVEHCYRGSHVIINSSNKYISRSGIWIMRGVLGRRDVILKW